MFRHISEHTTERVFTVVCSLSCVTVVCLSYVVVRSLSRVHYRVS